MHTVMADRDMLNGKRICRLIISTCTGIDLTAMHHYAELKPANPRVRSTVREGVEHYGYLGKQAPERSAIELSSITVTRVLTAREFDSNGRLLAPVGEATSRFNSEQSARQAAVTLFNQRFPAGWALVEGDEFDVDAKKVLLSAT